MKQPTLVILALLSAPLVLAGCHKSNKTTSAALSTSVGGDSQRLFGASTTSASPTVAGVGDLNSDKVTDFGIGDPDFASGGGRAVLHSGSSGKILHTIVGDPSKLIGLGTALAAAGDVDGDGFGDAVIGAPGSVSKQVRGVVLVVSGKTGDVLHRLVGRDGPAAFGATVAGLGDINSDKRGDVAVGEQRLDTEPARVSAFSGLDGSGLWTSDVVPVGVSGLGPVAMMTIHDVNFDGLADLLVASKGPNSLVLSARDGRVLRNHSGDAAAVAQLGDINGDRVAEYALGIPTRNNGRGQVEIISGATGQILRTLDGESDGAQFGSSIAAAGDRNADGRGDLLVGSIGAVRLYSGATGNMLGELVDAANPSALHKVSALGDLDGDGQPDYAVSVGSTITLYSGVPRSFSADRTDLPTSTGGVQQLSLRAGSANRGKVYQVLGSSTGTSPGIFFPNNVYLPLFADSYTQHTMVPSAGVHIAFVGVLDGDGNASAQFSIPAIAPDVIGVQLWHAFLVMGDLTPIFASNAVPVVLVK